MSLPSAWSTTRLTGYYITPSGEPEVGYVEFRVYPEQRIRVESQKTILVPGVIKVDLDGEGRFDIQIPSSNDPDISPHFRWHVRERFQPNKRFSYLIEVPHDEEEVDISDLEHHSVGINVG